MGTDYNREQIASIIATHRDSPGALLPILHAVQNAMGFVPPDSVEQIATALNLSRAEVHGVLTFYHHFRTAPPARHTLHICCAEACQSMGAEHLVEHAERTLAGKKPGEYEMHPVYCLGLCANSPAMMLDDELHARVTPDKFDSLLNKTGSKP